MGETSFWRRFFRWLPLLVGVTSPLWVAACPGRVSDVEDGVARDATAPDSAPRGGSGSSGSGSGLGLDDGEGLSSGESTAGAPAVPTCPAGSPLSCYVRQCSNGAHTTLTGKVYDPAGKVPLYNVVVYVPNHPNALPPFTPGTSSCNACDTISDYVAAAVTDKSGSFTLTDVPTGDNVPLVVQIGKWRRTITVSRIADCVTTALPDTGSGQARLPRSHQEGDMPQMALLTGGLDDLGCFLTRIGIDAAEYSAPQGGGRLDIYQGLGSNGFGLGAGAGMTGPGLSTGKAGDCTTTSCPLWASKQSLEQYDMVLLACEGDTFDPDATPDAGSGRANVTKAGKQAMHDWLNEGGKVFATHLHYTWFQNGPADFQGVADWLGSSAGSATCDCSIDRTFPEGQTFHDWLQAVGASSGNGVSLTDVAESVGAVSMDTSRWIYDSTDSETKSLSFETPVGGIPVVDDSGALAGRKYCGKALFSDLHAGGAPSGDIPGSCKQTDLSAEEKALEFLFFDLASCIVVAEPGMLAPPNPSP